MPPIYDVPTKTARMTATRDMVANGTLELLSAGGAVLAIFGLTNDAGSVSGDVWTMGLDSTTVSGESAAGAGLEAVKGRVKNSSGTIRITGLTVGLVDSGADLITVSRWVTSGLPVKLDSANFRHAPDPA